MTPITFLVLVALLFFGAAGWGAIAVRVLERAGWRDAAAEIGFALRVLLGVSLFLAVGGYLVALGIARPAVLLGWHVVGLLYLLNGLRPLLRRPAYPRGLALVRAAALGAIGAFLFLMSLGYAIGVPFYNPPDDDPGYVYLAQRLVSTGGLVDPFNLRRFTSYGGSTLYQSLFLRLTGNGSLRGSEITFGALLLLVAATRTARRRWLLLFVVVVGVGILVGQGIGPIINLSPAYSVAALSLGAYQLLSMSPASTDGRRQNLLYVVLGVMLAAILALRWMDLLSMVFATVLVLVVLLGRAALRAVLVTGATALACTAGWAVALSRSSGSPVPLGGNFDPSYPNGTSPYVGLAQIPRKFWAVVSANGSAEILGLGICLAVGYLLFTSRHSTRMLVLLCASIGCIFQAVLVTYLFTGSITGDVERFFAPSVFACGLFAIDTLWPTGPPSPVGAGRRRSVTVALAGLVGMIVVTFGNVPGALTHSQSFETNAGFSLEASGARIMIGATGFADRYRPYRREFARVNSVIPSGARVLAAVERPALLDLSRFEVATLDIPGAVSPPPHMPYFRGPAAKIAYLRHLGFDYIVTERPDAPGGLYNDWAAFLRSTSYFRRAYATYFPDWQATVNWLERDGGHRVTYAGSLALIQIR